MLALSLLFYPVLGVTASTAPTSPNAPGLVVGGSGLQPSYEPEFSPFGRDVIGRAPPGVHSLQNNMPERLNLGAGKMACYLVQKSMLFGTDEPTAARNELRHLESDESTSTEDADVHLSKRQNTRTKTVYLSANTCLQPRRTTSSNSTEPPPQLWLSISTNSQDGCPDPSQDKPGVRSISFEEGAAALKADVTGDIYVGIQAPNITDDFEDVYSFEVAASIDDYYHKYDDNKAELLWMDSDASSVLLMTKSLTQDQDQVAAVMKQPLPYELFIQDDSSPRLKGIQRSVCGLTEFAAIVANREGNGQQSKLVRSKLTTHGPGQMPAQQFYLDGLKASSSYTGILVKLANNASLSVRQDGAGSVGGRGTVFEATTFQTLSENANCQLVSDLEFCDEIPYAAPGNRAKFNNTELGKKYDNYAREMYENFEKVMMQIPCETEATSQYSLARNCDDCKEAYKRWLCTVIIPRCDLMNSTNEFAIPRNVGQAFPNGTNLSEEDRKKWGETPGHNSSRNSFIDTEIQPGPYREILPCEEVCYEVVQSCPAAIGFQCPQPGMVGFDVSYAQRDDEASVMACNYPGEPRTRVGAAGIVKPSTHLLVTVGLIGPLLFLFL